ncbi:TetR/AcrR family transcriptional regulator [Arenicella sp. 4NH20-0111]|uniref:TetR/AcrR family transcriptional regulator n=1 Tax=Arenicella sp. 4NH20-0111 TaxID=3127648 RepID=UPI00310A8CE9
MQDQYKTPEKNVNEKGSATRNKILLAASELFLEGGVAALSVRAISKRAGLSTIGIYSHFNGKQGVLDALYIDGFNMVYEAMNVELNDDLGIQHVLMSCQSYLKVAFENEAHYRLIFGESDMGYEPSAQAREAATRAFKKLVSNTDAYVKSMSLNVDRLTGALDIWAVMHGYVSISHHAMANEKLDWMGMALKAVERQINSWGSF